MSCGKWTKEWFCSRLCVRERREKEKRRVRMFRPSSNCAVPAKAKHEPKLVDLHGAGGDGAGEKQLSQRQQLPHSPHLQEDSRQRIATPATKKNCRRNSRHHRRRHRSHHSRRHGHRRCHCYRRRRCHRRCHRRRWYRCYHYICKPAVQPGLCLNLWLLQFVLQEKRK